MSLKEKERIAEQKIYRLTKKYQRLRDMKRRLADSTQTVLTSSQKKEIIQYYKPFIKLKETMGHEWYTQKTGRYYINYIPDWVWYGYIDPFYNDIDLAPKMENKVFLKNMFRNCPQPENLACRANGIWYTIEKGVMSYEDMLYSIQNERVLFIKQANESCGGFGVFKIEGENVLEKVKDIINKINKDIVIQKPIRQSECLNAINSSSVNTIRVLSLLRTDAVKIYSMVLRVGAGKDSYVDNACSGGLMIGISPEGKLRSKAYYRNGDCCTSHPVSGVAFDGIVIPNIEGVKRLVESLHPQVPYFRLISWDIVLDENDEPLLLEANLREGGVFIHQLANGPVFGEDTIAILNEVFGRKNNN